MEKYSMSHLRRFTFVLYDIDKCSFIKNLIIYIFDPLTLVVSPLHPSDDNCKREHYHFYVLLDYCGSADMVCYAIRKFNISKFFRVKNPVSLIRYFCHYDNPEKGVQFDPSELSVYGDIDIMQYF